MSILIVTPEFPPSHGGIGTHSYEMARCWGESEQVVVVTPKFGRGRSTIDFGFRVVEIAPAGRTRRQVTFTRAIRKLVCEHPFDAIYVTHWRACGPAVRLAMSGLSDRPAVIQAIHGSEVMYLLERRSWAHRILFRRVTSRARLFVALGPFQLELLQGLGVTAERIFESPEGIDPSRFTPPAPEILSRLRLKYSLDGRLILLTVGRLVERKGHDTVIAALPEIRRAVPGATYLVVGTGPNLEFLKGLVTRVGLAADAVHFCGAVPAEELAAYYFLCDLFVMPNRVVGSDVEGFGIVFMESAACGKASIGGRSGGVAEAISDGKTGILVDPTSTDELSAAVVRLLTDSDLRNEYGRAARERALNRFSYARIAAEIRGAMVRATES